jgi:hypothetical protein
MNPQSLSFLEAHGKHRSSDEIKDILRQNQVLEARAYRMGDPVNSPDNLRADLPTAQGRQPAVPARKPLLYRFFRLIFSPFSIHS